MIEPIQQCQKIRKIGAPQTKQNGISGTWLGMLYRRRFKQYAFLRFIAHWVWRNGYPIYVKIVASLFFDRENRWRPVIGLREFAKATEIVTCKLADSSIVETPAPRVFPTRDQGYLVSPHDRYTFPEVFVATVSNAMTYGGTNLILVDGEVVCHDLFDLERDFTSEELHGRALLSPKKKRIRWLLHDRAPEQIPVAASFVDACASNYAHWMTEVLPRIVLFCGDERFNDVPIVVNDGLHQNIMNSLLLVAGANREIVLLPIGRALAVRELYVTSVAGYVPFERRKAKLAGHSHGKFSSEAFLKIRSTLTVSSADLPEKIFLRRNSGVRRVTNACEIEKLLVSGGFTVVEPEKLGFIEQVQLFSNAKEIVASSGAALANMIFCASTTEIFILISKQPNTSYWYWQNIAAASGKYVHYILGEAQGESSKGIHNDFYIPPDEVLKTVLRK